jgi:aspartokinase-like uncharacterized kinase
MSPDAILKVGGSLSRGEGLEALCAEISRLGNRFGLLVVPGGGKFADLVRKAYRQYGLSEAAAHFMALLAMDQYGYVLHHLIRGGNMSADLADLCREEKSSRVGILLPSAEVMRSDPLPHTWQVTSDTIAAWIAHRTACRRLVLLKDVDGILTGRNSKDGPGQLISTLTVKRLAEIEGGVDRHLARFLEQNRLETWIINGLHPERLSELMETGRTTGTFIKPDPP